MIYNENKEDVLKRIEKIAYACFGIKDKNKISIHEGKESNILATHKTIKIVIESEQDIYVSRVDLESFYIQTSNELISYYYVFEHTLMSFKLERNILSFDLAINFIYGIDPPKEGGKFEFTLA